MRDSDGTVVFSIEAVLSGGSKDTIEFARKYRKPVLHLWRNGGTPSPAPELLRFVRDHEIGALNVARPRASYEPEIASFTGSVLERAFGAD